MANNIVQLKDKDGNNIFPISGGSESMPVGTEVSYDGETVPAGWQEVDDPSVYSTTEQVVGTWIDGKPLYRKIYETGTLTTSEVTVDTISDINVKKLNAMLVNSNGAVQVYGAYREDNSTSTSRVFYDGAYVKVQQGAAWQNSGYHALVEVQYTKTTD